MGESLIQPCRVVDDGPLGCKHLFFETNKVLYAPMQVSEE